MVCCVFRPANACLGIYYLMFLIVFDHGNACASMHLLVEIHNNGVIEAIRALISNFVLLVGKYDLFDIIWGRNTF